MPHPINPEKSFNQWLFRFTIYSYSQDMGERFPRVCTVRRKSMQ